MTSTPNISFEHFDPRFELGNQDNNGNPIRIRKKPGRKPNPPSPAQRKAQNRAAQRAFRERKRCEMKQAETTVKQCLYIRGQALGETQRLKKRLEEMCFENNYLKASLLTLKLACLANRVEVPQLWDSDGGANTDLSTNTTNDQLPQAMGIFLDNHTNIINLSQPRHNASPPSTAASLAPSSPMSIPRSLNSFICSPPSYMIDLHQHETCPVLSSSPVSSYSGSNSTDSIQDFPSTITNPSQWLSLSLPESLDAVLTTPSSLSTTIDSSLTLPVDYDTVTGSLDDNASDNVSKENSTSIVDKWMEDVTILPQQPTPVLDPKTGLERHKTIILDDMNDQFSEPPTTTLSLTSAKLKSAPPMNTMDALQYIRTIKNLDDGARTLFKPTELQQMIPHDTRIDLVPCPIMRDLMIVYQDFYNANELFEFLMDSASFLGGDLENPNDWMVPPAFVHTFWFLFPHDRPQRLDHLAETAVDVGQTMIKRIMERKAMGNERCHFIDTLHLTEDMQQNKYYQLQQQQQQQQQLCDHDDHPSRCKEQAPEMNMLLFDAFSKDDHSLDAMMTFVDDGELLISM